VTKTNLFAGAVAHAGISSISSYWGEGYWGYSYSATATANSFPWNRGDIYVEQSPLFHADRVDTPILLTHGRSDTNVPVGESDAFFIALKLLGKTVEYVQISGQDHLILDPEKRTVWSQTVLAWFDRWLKGRSEWWESMR
jgi:dipeptidyl aminopeptidase/acylaminoacyl peptidase